MRDRQPAPLVDRAGLRPGPGRRARRRDPRVRLPAGRRAAPAPDPEPDPGRAAGAAIDAMVAEQGGSLYELDGEPLAELRPDLILTQEQCDLCAVNVRWITFRCVPVTGGRPLG